MFSAAKTGGQFSSIKGTRKIKKDGSTSRSFLQGASALREINSARLSLNSSVRMPKIVSNSLEKLSFISEKDGCTNSEFENYELEYSTYLLRKLQNKLLSKDKEGKENNVKKCFISLKWEYEHLLNKNVKLKEDIGYFKMYFETIEETKKRIKIGKDILNILRENKFDILLDALSQSLDHKINQLQLVDIDKTLVEEAISIQVSGENSGINECIQRINNYIKTNKSQISNIAEKLLTIRKLCQENSILRERCYNAFKTFSDELLETNYEEFTGAVLRTFRNRQELCHIDPSRYDNDLFNFDEILKRGNNIVNDQESNLLSKFESSCNLRPNSSSTPQPN